MKRVVTKHMQTFALIGIAAMTFAGCGGSDENWGIDHAREMEVTHGPLDTATGLYRCTIEDATLVEPGGIVRPLTKDTQLRVWHYQNSQEYVCTLKGQALVKQPVKGEQS